MAKCSVCGKPAVYVAKYEGKAYCPEHFLEWFDRRVRKTIRKYRMFGKKEKIVVAVSGGKDSLAALHYMKNLSKRVPGWEVEALLIDEGIQGYRPITIKDFKKWVEEWEVPYRILSFKDEIGASLDEIVTRGHEKRLPYQPCTYCGVFRRYFLNKGAKEMGATVLVTGHNLDDEIQTFLMNIMRHDIDRLARLGPVTGVSEHEGFVKRVKIFYDIPEKEVVVYSMINGFFPEFVECPYARLGFRWDLRHYINLLEDKYPGTKFMIQKSLLDIVSELKKTRREGKPKKCKICGESATGEVCRACELRILLGLMEPPDWFDVKSIRI